MRLLLSDSPGCETRKYGDLFQSISPWWVVEHGLSFLHCPALRSGILGLAKQFSVMQVPWAYGDPHFPDLRTHLLRASHCEGGSLGTVGRLLGSSLLLPCRFGSMALCGSQYLQDLLLPILSFSSQALTVIVLPWSS